MNARIARTILILLISSAGVEQAYCAEPPGGKVVWWGMSDPMRAWDRAQTNGVIELANEIVGDVIAIAARRGNGLAVRSDGTVLAFGIGWFGAKNVPAGLSDVVSVGVEDAFCWAIKRDGSVAIWGDGTGYSGVVRGLSNVVTIAAAGNCTHRATNGNVVTIIADPNQKFLALTRDQTVLQVCSDGPIPQVEPVRVGGQILSNVIAMTSARPRPLVVKKDGGIYEYDSAEPITAGGKEPGNVMALAHGDGQILALERNGTVVAWGDNLYGETNVPAGLGEVTSIAADEHQSLALKRDGTVVAWGGNYFGQTSVPAGLSNVTAIAAGWQFGLALTTGAVPSSVYIIPHGQLEIMERKADLIFKGTVVSSRGGTNASFPDWAKPHATEFKIISVLKGKPVANSVVFWHFTGDPGNWSGRAPPESHRFEAGQAYLVYAARLDRAEDFYTVPSDAASRSNELRQLYDGGVMRTLDDRAVVAAGFKEAHWREIDLLLHDKNPTNQLYAIDKLDQMSLAGRGDDHWRHSDDFKRKAVLSAVLPLVTNNNEEVANRAMGCFATEASTNGGLNSFSDTLMRVANEGATSQRRLNAIRALSGTHFEAISNSLAQLLKHSDASVRATAIGLLARHPGEFSEEALRLGASDESPKVRAGVADVIGDGKIANLLPTLEKLLSDPVGLTNPLPPLTMAELQAGGQIWNNNNGDVHTSAGYALLKFEVEQVSNILTAHLNDTGFRPNYLCKLAEKNPGPWLTNLVEVLEGRRDRIWREVEAGSVEPKTDYFQARMALSGSYYQCWKIICGYLQTLPPSRFGGGNFDRCLDALENAGTTGSQEPTTLYELYLTKGLKERAIKYRAHCEKTSGYDISIYFKKVDERVAKLPASK